jgi:hypothetical protein
MIVLVECAAIRPTTRGESGDLRSSKDNDGKDDASKPR